MRRRLFNWLTVLSLGVGLAAVPAWVASDRRAEELFRVDGRLVWSVISANGELAVGWHRLGGGALIHQGTTLRHNPGASWVFGRDRFERWLPVRLAVGRAATGGVASVPVDDVRLYLTVPASSVVIVLQYRAVVGLAAAVFGLRLWRRRLDRRVARWRATGCCPACGYDLRATPGGCPECGRGVVAFAVSPPSSPPAVASRSGSHPP